MALGNTNISVTLVKNTLGIGTTTVGGLIQSENVNPWGFNLPLQVDQNKYFGNLPRTAPYELGAFRNYDHTWRCYTITNPTISSNLAYYESGNIVINLRYFPSNSTATANISHIFDIYFNRVNDFTHSSHIQLYNDYPINDNGTLTIPINPYSPPDGGTALPANSSVYFKIKHVSSPDRRWDKNQFSQVVNIISKDIEDDAYIIKVDIGADVFTYYTDFYKTSAPLVWKYGTSGGMNAYVTVKNGNKSPVTVAMLFEINNSSAFNGTTSYIANGSFVIPAGTVVNGALSYGISNVTITLSNALTKFSAGQAYYGRVKITSVTSGTYNGNYATGYNGTILNTPPRE